MINRPLSALHLGNFKAFGAAQRIPLKPLTLIFGPNSAGKSSIIHALALAHEAKRSGNLDAFRTELGGTSIDLGGFRQYVFRRQAANSVEWAAEIDVSKLKGRLAELLAPVGAVAVSATVGVPLDNEGAAVPGAAPSVMTYDVEADGAPLLRMSRRRDGPLKLDRLATDHPVLRHVLKAIIEGTTTASELKPDDQPTVDDAVNDLVPTLAARAGAFLPAGLDLGAKVPESAMAEAMLFPVSKADRAGGLTEAVRFYLPRVLNELIGGLTQVIDGELDRLQYLGPLRSYPPRHLAFSEHDDVNWRAGGGYAWDVLRRDAAVRDKVNRWLGSEWLQTPYRLQVRPLYPWAEISDLWENFANEMARDQISALIKKGVHEELFNWHYEAIGEAEKDPQQWRMFVSNLADRVSDIDSDAKRFAQCLEKGASSISDLVMTDCRTDTIVSHRDVGIGISQVLPVLVSAFGSENAIVAIEQPEIHLHPALQAELGDVFIEAALGGRGNTFFLETHSEHLILRLLRRIRETADGELPPGAPALRPDDVAVSYVEPTDEGARIRHLRVNDKGDFLDRWPRGFFEERVDELF
ncbi:MAG TPA: AAA family ATPase [Defluviicoccus sp.]|nr:AAA family ATPase [Defluviicoccus sp.]